MIRGTINLPGFLGQITNLAFLARALETQAAANILSTPALLTLDNEEARIIVGQNVPFVTGSVRDDRRNDDGRAVPDGRAPRRRARAARAPADHRRRHGAHDDLPGSVAHPGPVGATGIILSKRALESSVVVDDNQIVVLGGLIEDRMTDGSDKVPVLGDVPGVGTLFRYDSRRREKTNLMVFLKPTVLRTTQDGREITSERYEYLRSEQQRLAPGLLPFWHDPTKPELPAQGTMPGTPGATPPPPPSPPHPLAPFMPKPDEPANK